MRTTFPRVFFFSVLRTRCSFIIKPSIDRFVLKLEHEFVEFSDVNILPHFTVVQKRFYLDIMFNFSYFEIKRLLLTKRSLYAARIHNRADPRSHKLLTIFKPNLTLAFLPGITLDEVSVFISVLIFLEPQNYVLDFILILQAYKIDG